MAVTARFVDDYSYNVPADQKFTFNNQKDINDYLNWYNKGSIGNIVKGVHTTKGIAKDIYDFINDGMKDLAGSGQTNISDVVNTVTNPTKYKDTPAPPVDPTVPDDSGDELTTQFQSLIDQIYDINESNNAKMVENAERQMRFQEQSQAKAMQFNAEQAKLDRDWQEYMSNTAHQREVGDLIAAGLNPVLSANGGAAVGSGASASASNQSGSLADVDTSVTNFLGNLAGAFASMKNAETNAKAALGSASIHASAMRAAAKYGLIGNIGGTLVSSIFGLFNPFNLIKGSHNQYIADHISDYL